MTDSLCQRTVRLVPSSKQKAPNLLRRSGLRTTGTRQSKWAEHIGLDFTTLVKSVNTQFNVVAQSRNVPFCFLATIVLKTRCWNDALFVIFYIVDTELSQKQRNNKSTLTGNGSRPAPKGIHHMQDRYCLNSPRHYPWITRNRCRRCMAKNRSAGRAHADPRTAGRSIFQVNRPSIHCPRCTLERDAAVFQNNSDWYAKAAGMGKHFHPSERRCCPAQ